MRGNFINMDSANKIKDTKKVCSYWQTSSDNDYNVMMNLYNSKNYNWALFLGHIVIEKLIKAFFVKTTEQHAPFTHDLRFLAKNCGLELPDDKTCYLDVITGFNINTRYDSFNEDFYKRCTPEFSAEWIEKINDLRTWIKEKL